MRKRIVLLMAGLVILAAGWVAYLYWMAGQFKTIRPHFSGTCRVIGGVIGPEDITIHPRTGIAYVSGCDRRAVQEGGPARGAIYAYDLNAVTREPVNLTPDADPGFRPHGISLFVGTDGRDTLFVVNHQGGAHRIEVFELRDGKLSHAQTLTSPLLVSPNDIVAVGPDRFYVTNDHRYRSGWMQKLEDYFRLSRSNVLYYNGSEFVEAASGIAYANGINVSPDGKTLFVCSVTEGALHVYDRDPASGRLKQREEIDLHTGLDNVEVAANGDLWIGAHPKLFDFIAYAKDHWAVSPSQVLHLSPDEGGGYDVEEVFLDTGEQISGSSVAAVLGNRLLIGSVFDAKFLDCNLSPGP